MYGFVIILQLGRSFVAQPPPPRRAPRATRYQEWFLERHGYEVVPASPMEHCILARGGNWSSLCGEERSVPSVLGFFPPGPPDVDSLRRLVAARDDAVACVFFLDDLSEDAKRFIDANDIVALHLSPDVLGPLLEKDLKAANDNLLTARKQSHQLKTELTDLIAQLQDRRRRRDHPDVSVE